ncbi:MAG: glycoside hydrolase family 65 protein [Actinomycetota bacterium]
MNGWILSYDGFDPGEEGLREALCTLGNGYFATRGAAPERAADDVHYPGTYVAGCYDRLVTKIAGRDVENEDIVNLPNWLPLSFRIGDGPWFGEDGSPEIVEHHQELDLRRGLLSRRALVRDGDGRETVVEQRRFVHMEQAHLAGLSTVITPRNWSGRIAVRSGVDGEVRNAGVRRYRELRGDHLVPGGAVETGPEAVLVHVRTRNSGIEVAVAARTRVRGGGEAVEGARSVERSRGAAAHVVEAEAAEGEPITVEKIVALFTSRDPAISEPREAARLSALRAGSFEELLTRHELAWEHLWRLFDIELDGADRAQLVLRLHVFHVLQTVSPATVGLDVGVPARGLHGEAYRGHIFWDELFILPFLSLRIPALTRSLLEHRYRRLDEARNAAAQEGRRGATFPWQSGSSGREETQSVHLNPNSGRWLPDNSRLQKHINIAVAFNAWHHFQVTGDEQFLRYRGAPILLELSRYWASVAELDEVGDRFHIRGVMGPDEYHDAYPDADHGGLDDNAYTNVMVAWTIARTIELLDGLAPYHRGELVDTMSLTEEELALWDEISRRLSVPFHGDRIISQFRGYGDLEEFDWVRYVERYGDIQRLDRILEAEDDTTNRYQVSKQADVLMLFYLLPPEDIAGLFDRLGYRFDPAEDLPRNIDYYMRRTSHGSTLSRVVHAWVLARFDRPRSWDLFTQSLESDIADVQGGTTAEGVHLGAMAGSVDLVQRGYAGVEVRSDLLSIRPAPPEALSAMRFTVQFRGERVEVDLTPDRLAVHVLPGGEAPIRIAIDGEESEVPPGGRLERALGARGRRRSRRR